MMFSDEAEKDDDEDDIFETLGVDSSPPAKRGADLLDAVAEDDGIIGTLSFDSVETVSDDDSDDIDPFDLIEDPRHASQSPTDSEPDSFVGDALEALLSDEDDDSSTEEDAGSPATAHSAKTTSPASRKDDTSAAYRLLLETVWVDNQLDPSEVALLVRKREALGIDFNSHLQMVHDIIDTDVSGHEEALDNDAAALGVTALQSGLSKQEWLKAYEWCEALGCGEAFALGVWSGSSAVLAGEVHELLKPLAKLLGVE
jgi:hypothetical protein